MTKRGCPLSAVGCRWQKLPPSSSGSGRLADAGPTDVLRFSPDHNEKLAAYFRTSGGAPFVEAIQIADALIDGFQSPLGMEALATVGWLLDIGRTEPTLHDIRAALNHWPTPGAAERKQRLFSDKLIQVAIDRLSEKQNGNSMAVKDDQ